MSDERLRLFVALELPDAIRDALVGWRSGVAREADGLRLIRPQDLHVTLCFLGWQPGEAVDAIAEVCGAAVAAWAGERFELTVGPAVWLPPRRPRVLAVELVDAPGRLTSLQAALSDGLATGGWYRPEKRPFRAHATVARVGRGARVRAVEMPVPPEERFTPEHVTLFRSRLSRAGARYEAVARIGIG